MQTEHYLRQQQIFREEGTVLPRKNVRKHVLCFFLSFFLRFCYSLSFSLSLFLSLSLSLPVFLLSIYLFIYLSIYLCNQYMSLHLVISFIHEQTKLRKGTKKMRFVYLLSPTKAVFSVLFSQYILKKSILAHTNTRQENNVNFI